MKSMKTTIYAVLLVFLSLVAVVRASSPVVVDITTAADATTSYTVNHLAMTGDEVEGWFREAVKFGLGGYPVYVRPDQRTSFQAVFALLCRLKAVGVPRFEVVVAESKAGDFQQLPALAGTGENVRESRIVPPEFPALPRGR